MKFRDFLLESSSEVDAEGKRIAKMLGLDFISFWKDMGKYLFNDRQTGSSVTGSDFAETKSKVEASRAKFKGKKVY
jgi:hypothetical protein